MEERRLPIVVVPEHTGHYRFGKQSYFPPTLLTQRQATQYRLMYSHPHLAGAPSQTAVGKELRESSLNGTHLIQPVQLIQNLSHILYFFQYAILRVTIYYVQSL